MSEENALELQDALPCPFCGGKTFDIDDDGVVYWVVCLSCSVDGPIGSKESAIKKWNERKT